MTIQNNPNTAHPLADQATWWATDESTKEAEAALNQELMLNNIQAQNTITQSKLQQP